MINDILVIIPARGGSKGIPGKNIKELGGKPLIYYTIDIARSLFPDEQICVSTDDNDIINTVERYGLKVPFIRPAELSSDTASSQDVIFHALEFYKSSGKKYKYTLLLQPTSPFRTEQQLKQLIDIASKSNFEMIVSVKETEANPYFVLMEENENGILIKSKPSNFTRRQDCPNVWEVNGAFYLINNHELIAQGGMSNLQKKKFVMDALHSVDLDTPIDWSYAEFLIKEGRV